MVTHFTFNVQQGDTYQPFILSCNLVKVNLKLLLETFMMFTLYIFFVIIVLEMSGISSQFRLKFVFNIKMFVVC